MNHNPSLRKFLLSALAACMTLGAAIQAQEVLIPDPGLNAAIRVALEKPRGPLTRQDLLSLTVLNACCRSIGDLAGLEEAPNLITLDLHANSLTSVHIPGQLTRLRVLDLFQNQLASFALTNALSELSTLDLGSNALKHCSLPAGLTNLETLSLRFNQLTNLNLPSGLTQLVELDLRGNPLLSVTIPPDVTRLATLLLEVNLLDILVLTEPLAATNLAETVALLRKQGVEVFAYALAPRLFQFRSAHGAFQFSLTAPPGDYTILVSDDLAVWRPLRTVKNRFGISGFTEVTPPLADRRFYRAIADSP